MICKQVEAKVHLTQLDQEGKIKKVDLCEACAKAKGVDDPTGFSLADLLLGLGASQEMAQATGGSETRCPSCGFTQADFKKSGRLGCAECYLTFADGLEGLLKTMHKGTRHVGKAPRAAHPSKDVRDQIKALQKRLEQAIASENFEEAARLRDELKMLKEGVGGIVTA
jgi:protein arginine kinase activator